jgi:hypothetical protein
MTIQNLYTQYLDGKITQSKFLYEARRDQNLDMISSNNSFDDVVKILKNKSIISEKAHKEAKLATGKQEVEVISKTIDMVNPYEYTRGMNYELEIMDVPATSGDLSEDNILKAQKKVLANLTKNPSFYFDKINGKGEVSDEWVEVTKKEIDKIGKGKKNMMREGARPGYHEDGTPKSNDEMSDDELEDFYNDSNFLDEGGNLGHNELSSIHQEGAYWIVTYRGPEGTTEKPFTSEEEARKFQDGLNEHGQYTDRVADVNADSSPLKEDKISTKEITQALIPLASNKEEIIQYMQSLRKSGDEFETVDDYVEDFRNYVADKSLEEHGEYFDRVSDMNISQSPLEEAKLRIYEKYAQKMNKTIDEVKCMVDEAIALKDKAGNIQYAKDSTEASTIEKNAKSKGITLTKTAV